MKIQLSHKFEDIISVDNLLSAWQEFIKGKRNKKDVQEFSFNLMDNILSLHCDLNNHTYKHDGYQGFNICDPKPRVIHKASVKDRLLHRAIYRILYSFFDRIFISDSFSCRDNKGTHKAISRFCSFAHQVSKDNTKPCWILKCDIKKFFASINHDVLINILSGYIPDNNILLTLEKVINSFAPDRERKIGLPLGNLTSQIFANIYMNEFDQFIKHRVKAKCYIRYADDFVILSQDRFWLEEKIILIREFLEEKLKLSLHEGKIFIKTLFSGVDFLGWVNFSNHKTLRSSTRKRMFKKIKINPATQTLNSYVGLLSHGSAYKLKEKILFRIF